MKARQGKTLLKQYFSHSHVYCVKLIHMLSCNSCPTPVTGHDDVPFAAMGCKAEDRQSFYVTESGSLFPILPEKMADIPYMENEPLLPSCGSGFLTSNRRQYGVIIIVNLATFLQGASVATSAISVPRMPTNESMIDDTSWPFDFVVTDQDAFWIS